MGMFAWPWKKKPNLKRGEPKEEPKRAEGDKLHYHSYVVCIGIFGLSTRDEKDWITGYNDTKIPEGMPILIEDKAGEIRWVPYGRTTDFKTYSLAELKEPCPTMEVRYVCSPTSRERTALFTQDGRIFMTKYAHERLYRIPMEEIIEHAFNELRIGWKKN